MTNIKAVDLKIDEPISKRTFTFEELNNLSSHILEQIKKDKQNELYDKNKERHIQISNILSLQKLIEDT